MMTPIAGGLVLTDQNQNHTELAPLAVWDTRTEEFFSLNVEEIMEWARHNLPARDIIRIEFYLYDTPFAVITRAMVQDGYPFIDIHAEIVVHDPEIITIRSLPPEHLIMINGRPYPVGGTTP
jgi:hypothetical protein